MADEQMKPKKTMSVSDIMGGKPSAKPKGESKPKSGKDKKTKHKHTHIEHHDDGSHTVRHTPQGGGEEISYAAPDMDAVHDGLEQHVGEPNGDEGQEAQAQPDQGGPEAAPQQQQPTPGQGA